MKSGKAVNGRLSFLAVVGAMILSLSVGRTVMAADGDLKLWHKSTNAPAEMKFLNDNTKNLAISWILKLDEKGAKSFAEFYSKKPVLAAQALIGARLKAITDEKDSFPNQLKDKDAFKGFLKNRGLEDLVDVIAGMREADLTGDSVLSSIFSATNGTLLAGLDLTLTAPTPADSEFKKLLDEQKQLTKKLLEDQQKEHQKAITNLEKVINDIAKARPVPSVNRVGERNSDPKLEAYCREKKERDDRLQAELEAIKQAGIASTVDASREALSLLALQQAQQARNAKDFLDEAKRKLQDRDRDEKNPFLNNQQPFIPNNNNQQPQVANNAGELERNAPTPPPEKKGGFPYLPGGQTGPVPQFVEPALPGKDALARATGFMNGQSTRRTLESRLTGRESTKILYMMKDGINNELQSASSIKGLVETQLATLRETRDAVIQNEPRFQKMLEAKAQQADKRVQTLGMYASKGGEDDDENSSRAMLIQAQNEATEAKRELDTRVEQFNNFKTNAGKRESELQKASADMDEKIGGFKNELQTLSGLANLKQEQDLAAMALRMPGGQQAPRQATNATRMGDDIGRKPGVSLRGAIGRSSTTGKGNSERKSLTGNDSAGAAAAQ